MTSSKATRQSGYCRINRSEERIPIARNRIPLSLIHFGLVRSFTVHKIVEHFTPESPNL